MRVDAEKLKCKDAAIKIMNVIALNEISGNLKFAYKFSKASGGTSGWSFGRSQFDTKNNPNAIKFLKNKCGFSDSDINILLSTDDEVIELNNKLREHMKDIDAYDLEHTQEMIKHVMSLSGMPELENERVFVHLVDYHNQFNLSVNGKMHNYLKTLKIATCENILNFKLSQTKWGKERPADVIRRYTNIENNYK